MSKLAKLALAGLMLGTGCPAMAAGWWEPVQIARIAVDNSGTAFLRLEPITSAAGNTPPACSNNGYWQVAFDAKTPAGQAMLSIALSARTARQPARVVSGGACTANPTVADLGVVDILPPN